MVLSVGRPRKILAQHSLANINILLFFQILFDIVIKMLSNQIHRNYHPLPLIVVGQNWINLSIKGFGIGFFNPAGLLKIANYFVHKISSRQTYSHHIFLRLPHIFSYSSLHPARNRFLTRKLMKKSVKNLPSENVGSKSAETELHIFLSPSSQKKNQDLANILRHSQIKRHCSVKINF